jgi:DNA-binding response OmpR family regulator
LAASPAFGEPQQYRFVPLEDLASNSLRRVLVVDDDEDLCQLLSRLLEAEGYGVDIAGNGPSALDAVGRNQPDLVLLDIGLANEDGRDVLQALRRASDVPVVFLTGRGHEIDRIAGLRMGADDYIVKPFSPGELTARVESVLRRAHPRANHTGLLRFGALHLDARTREVVLNQRRVEMTTKEFDLLFFLASSPRQVFSREQLLDQVWSSSSEWQTDATVTEHIRRLRRKIEADPDQPAWITTVRGAGYRFEPH